MGTRGVSAEDCRYLTIRDYGNSKIYDIHFRSVGDIQLFLKSNPDRNREVFPGCSSEKLSEEFAGPPLEQAIDYCIGGYKEHFEQFLELGRQLEKVNKRYKIERRTEQSFVGQRPNVPAYIAGAPKNMYRTQSVAEKKQINVFMNVTYPFRTTQEQIQHRGIIVLNMIQLLEQNDYIVNFRLFECCAVKNEIFLCEVVLKRPGEMLDARKCYYPLCGKSFVRRVLCRVKESMPFEANWGLSYGELVAENKAKSIMGIRDEDLYISSPGEMDIFGKNIYEDANHFFAKLHLEDKIKVPNYGEQKW